MTEELNTTEIQEQSQTESSSFQESAKEINLRILRERAEAAEKRAWELEQSLKYSSASQQQAEPDELPDIDESDYIDGKKYKHHYKALKNELKQAKKQVEEFTKQSSASMAEIRLKAMYSDFDNIVTAENIQKLSQMYPEDYSTLGYNPDLYAKGKTVYNMIKNYGINKNYGEIDRKLEENRNKPKAAATASPQQPNTPLGRVGDFDRRRLTEADKERLRQEMAQYSRRG